MVRCFIGLEIPDEIRNYVVDIQNKLKNLPIEAKFVEPENLHISLSFLGDIENGSIKNISSVLDKVCSNHARFIVNVDGIKLIPDENFVRVIALNVTGNGLENLIKDIENQIGGKSKSTHLTLCRVKRINDKDGFHENLASITPIDQNFEVTQVSLFKSTLQRTGPIYSILHKSELK